ncbi:MAG TPA: DUF2147 domain-containing protein [Bacteroidota bacterium]|nr:DUF2147 domain-containing protein [Bacteroidota bacterium]
MRMIPVFLAVCFFLPIASLLAQSQEADAVLGTWLVQDKNAKVEIYKRGSKYYGKIVWLKEPNDEQGKAKVDKENPEEKLRSRPILGLEMLRGFVYDEDYVWEDGEIYDPKNGKTYSCKMTLTDKGNTLDVRGYIGISLIGRTQEWTRVKQ